MAGSNPGSGQRLGSVGAENLVGSKGGRLSSNGLEEAAVILAVCICQCMNRQSPHFSSLVAHLRIQHQSSLCHTFPIRMG
mmetsp:Transcript_19210/g.32997  ORF Transcript_19210/g.32997 Transcript_19210/m.32997 type:complete len:80 (-) Transcript_19210:446-685(-)